MHLRHLAHQIRDWIGAYTNNENPRIRHFARISLLMVISLTISSTVATLADENSTTEPTPTVESIQPTPEPTPEPTRTDEAIVLINAQASTAADSSPASIATPDPSASAQETLATEESPLESPSPTPKPKPHPIISNVPMFLIVPRSISIDPRATRVFMPRTYLSGSGDALMCLRSETAIIDVAVKNQVDDFYESKIRIIGDMTNEVYITGSISFLRRYLNLQNGIQLTSNSGGLSGSYVRFDLVAMSEPGIDPSFCDAGDMRWTGIRSLGLTINTVQTSVTLRRKAP